MKTEVIVPILPVEQPIGRFYLGVMPASDLLEISFADMREIEGDLDRYVGIQRKLNKDRVREIADFVKSIDATFPTSVVLALKGCSAMLSADGRSLRIFGAEDPETGEFIPLGRAASILDGQHRIEGLKEAGESDFQVPVSIFVDADIADQAYIFATVNLAQTKVNKSLVYDLLDYSVARSPQKTAHDIAVAFDRYEHSPFYQLIKRLGAATPGRLGETLAQATVVNGIIPLLSKRPEQDRYDLARKKKLGLSDVGYADAPLRHLWINEKDGEIARILLDYFGAVRDRWPVAWIAREKGQILVRTNGFRALIRLFKVIYLKERPSMSVTDYQVSRDQFVSYFNRCSLDDSDFTTANFAPGTSGETGLYKRIKDELGL